MEGNDNNSILDLDVHIDDDQPAPRTYQGSTIPPNTSELHAGPRPGGGFEVRAQLPLYDEVEAALAAAAPRDPMEATA